MNGLTKTAHNSLAKTAIEQISLFNFCDKNEEKEQEQQLNEIPCKIFDWRANESIEFRSMIQKR